MMLLVLHAPPPMLKLDEPQVFPEGETTSTCMGGGACNTSSIIVGYDGTVVQQGPRERETCIGAGSQCTCTYRYWPGFFR